MDVDLAVHEISRHGYGAAFALAANSFAHTTSVGSGTLPPFASRIAVIFSHSRLIQ